MKLTMVKKRQMKIQTMKKMKKSGSTVLKTVVQIRELRMKMFERKTKMRAMTLFLLASG
jgi:hypothetical protein